MPVEKYVCPKCGLVHEHATGPRFGDEFAFRGECPRCGCTACVPAEFAEDEAQQQE